MTKVKITICEVLRRIIRDSNEPETRILASEAISMAQRMDKKLRGYKSDWDEGFWVEEEEGRIRSLFRVLKDEWNRR